MLDNCKSMQGGIVKGWCIKKIKYIWYFILEKVLVLLQFLEEVKAGESYLSFLLKERLRLVSKGLKFLSLFPPPPLWLLYVKRA